MVDSRAATAALGVVASLAVSAALWLYADTLVLFLVVPFVPLVLRGLGGNGADGRADERPSTRRCPECGFATRDPSFEHCPRDGTALRAGKRDAGGAGADAQSSS